MSFLRWIYDALAVIGTSALVVAGGLIILSAASSGYRKVERAWQDRGQAERAASREVGAARPPSASAEAATTPIPAARPLVARPVGLGQARADRIAWRENQSIFVQIQGHALLRTTEAWIERHPRGEFLLVTDDGFLTGKRATMGEKMLRLPNGSRSAWEYHTLPDGREGRELAYVRFCSAPPDSMLVVYLPVDSLVAARSTPCA